MMIKMRRRNRKHEDEEEVVDEKRSEKTGRQTNGAAWRTGDNQCKRKFH